MTDWHGKKKQFTSRGRSRLRGSLALPLRSNPFFYTPFAVRHKMWKEAGFQGKCAKSRKWRLIRARRRKRKEKRTGALWARSKKYTDEIAIQSSLSHEWRSERSEQASEGMSTVERASNASRAEQANEWAMQANEWMDKRVAQYFSLDSSLIWPSACCVVSPEESPRAYQAVLHQFAVSVSTGDLRLVCKYTFSYDSLTLSYSELVTNVWSLFLTSL